MAVIGASSSPIKSIQRGTTYSSSGVNVTITAVDLDKSFVSGTLLPSFDTSVVGQRWTGTAWETLPETAASAREWRDNELAATDWIMPVTDHPDRAAYVTYREELRQWPSTPSFPDTKPTLGV